MTSLIQISLVFFCCFFLGYIFILEQILTATAIGTKYVLIVYVHQTIYFITRNGNRLKKQSNQLGERLNR